MGSDVQVQEVKNTVQENINISETIKKLDNIRMFIYLFNEFGLPQVENEDKYIDYAVQHGSGLRVEDWYRTSLVGGTNLDYWGAIKQNCNDFGIDISNTNKYGFGWDFYTATRKFINSQSADTDKKSALKTWIDTLRDLDVIQARAELDKYLPVVEKPAETAENKAEKQDSVTEKPVEITDKSVDKPEDKTEKTVKTTLSAAEVLGNIAGPQLVQKIQQTNKKPVETLFGVPLDEFKAEFGGRSYGDYPDRRLRSLFDIKYDTVYNDDMMYTNCIIHSYKDYKSGMIQAYDSEKNQYVETEYYIALANRLWATNLSEPVNKRCSRDVIVEQVELMGTQDDVKFKLKNQER